MRGGAFKICLRGAPRSRSARVGDGDDECDSSCDRSECALALRAECGREISEDRDRGDVAREGSPVLSGENRGDDAADSGKSANGRDVRVTDCDSGNLRMIAANCAGRTKKGSTGGAGGGAVPSEL